MSIDFPNSSEKDRLLKVAKNQNFLLYLGRKFGYIHPRIYDLVFEVYRNFRMIKYFGIKNYFFNNQKGIPTFLIIGFPKSGTTSLYQYLLQHPNIFGAWLKESHFFSYGYDKGIDYYLQNFRFNKNKKSLYFESSTDYIYHPLALKRIKEFYPKMKFIVCLRNPIDQVYSHYNHQKLSGIELDSFETTLKKEEYRKKLHMMRLEKNIYNHQKIAIDIPYLYFGEYSTHIKRALKVFDHENFLFVDSDELKTNTQHVVNEIFDFLDLPKIDIKVKIHNSREYENKISSKTRIELSKYFEPFNKELETILKRNFSWT